MDIDKVQAAADALNSLVQMARLEQRRSELVRIAREGGIDWDVIAVAGGFSRSTAINLSKG